MKRRPDRCIAAAALAGLDIGIIAGKFLSTGISVLVIAIAGLGIWLVLNK